MAFHHLRTQHRALCSVRISQKGDTDGMFGWGGHPIHIPDGHNLVE